MSLTLYIGNDSRIKWVGLVDADGDPQNSATMTVTLKDADGNDVTGETWPLTMDYVASSSGDYQATLQETLSLTADQKLTAVIEISSGGLTGHREVPVTATIHTG